MMNPPHASDPAPGARTAGPAGEVRDGNHARASAESFRTTVRWRDAQRQPAGTTLEAFTDEAPIVATRRSNIFRNYLLGIASIVAGAGLTSATDSMLPLAMGAAVGVMCTFALVRAILAGALRKSST